MKIREHRKSKAAALLPANAGNGTFLLMINWGQCDAVERTPEKVSGAWVFKGTRLPVRAFFENIEDGARVEDFREWFPGVTREQVTAVLRCAEESVAAV